MEGNCIEIKNLTKKYKKFTLDNVSIDVPYGTVMGFVGENGAGKSTLMKCLFGVYKGYFRSFSR